MPTFEGPLHIRWADIDANFHLRHSCYYDFAAQMRLDVLEQFGITLRMMQEHGFGPILFREECVFKREIRLGDAITIDLRLKATREDRSRWSFRHHLTRNDGTLCAVLNVDGAWMDTRQRKLTAPPAVAIEALDQLPRTEDFAWT
jgi:acyl-CoA thioester hydrolase